MSNFSESELIPAALKIISNKPNGIATKDLIIKLRDLMSPSGEEEVPKRPPELQKRPPNDL